MKKEKCIECGYIATYDEKTPIAGSPLIKTLKDLSEKYDTEYELCICDACMIGNALFCLGIMIKSEVFSEKIIGDCLSQTGFDILKKQKEQKE